jgi:hypothetical protein
VEALPVSPPLADVVAVPAPDAVAAAEVKPVLVEGLAGDSVAAQVSPARVDWAVPRADERGLQPAGLVLGGCWPERLPADSLVYLLEQSADDFLVALPQAREQVAPVAPLVEPAPVVRASQPQPRDSDGLTAVLLALEQVVQPSPWVARLKLDANSLTVFSVTAGRDGLPWQLVSFQMALGQAAEFFSRPPVWFAPQPEERLHVPQLRHVLPTRSHAWDSPRRAR